MHWEYCGLPAQTLAPSAEIVRCLFKKLAAGEGGHSTNSGKFSSIIILLLFPAHKQGAEPKVNSPEINDLSAYLLVLVQAPAGENLEPAHQGKTRYGPFAYFSEPPRLSGKIRKNIIKIPVFFIIGCRETFKAPMYLRKTTPSVV